MSDAQGLYAEGIGVTASSTTWVDVCSISAGSFTPGKKYLIVASVLLSGSSGAEETKARLVHGTTPTEFTDSAGAYENVATTQKTSYGYVTVFEQPGTAEAVTLQISVSGTSTAEAHLGQIFALKLSDDFVENTDWFFAEVTTDYTTTNSFADCDSTEAASVTFTPNGTDDWLIVGHGYLTPAATNSSYGVSLFDSVEGLDEPGLFLEGEDTTNERRSHLLARTWTPSNASHTFQLRFRHETVAHTIQSSRIFALNMNKFAQHAFSYAQAEELPATSPSWTTTRTLSPTPDATGDWFILGSMIVDFNNFADLMNTRLQQNPAGGGLASDPNYGDDAPLEDRWDQSDDGPFQIFKLRSLSSGAARDIDMDVQLTAGIDLRVQMRHLVAFSMSLPGGAVALVVQDANHSHTSDSPALTQHHTLMVAEALQSQTVEVPELVQHHVLAVAEVGHTQSADNVTLVVDLVVQDASQGQSADDVSLIQHHVLAVQDAGHDQLVDNIAVGVDLIVQEAGQDHTADNVVLTQSHILVVQDAVHAQTPDAPGLVQYHTLVPDDTLHGHSVDGLVLVVGSVELIVADALQGHVADALALVQGHILVVTETAHSHTVDTLLMVAIIKIAMSIVGRRPGANIVGR